MAVKPGTPHIVAALKAWALEQALPLWSGTGFDAKAGVFHERLSADGAPDLAAPRRLRVQARQTYVFAHAAALGWCPPARASAQQGVDILTRKYRHADGGYVFSLTPEGKPADALRSAYDHMFVLLAFATAAKAGVDTRQPIDELLEFIDTKLAAPDGSYFEGVPRALPRRQNPHMHALEAFLALHECTGDARALPMATRLVELMQDKFLDRASMTIAENFGEDWRPSDDSVEPGHLTEWAALLRRYERAAKQPQGALAGGLLQSALHTADPKTGLLPDEANRSGKVVRGSHRLWPQAELARAWIAQAEAGESGAADKARAALQNLQDLYVAPAKPGLWIEQLDAQAKPLAGPVPATSLYHLFGVIADADRVVG